ncbi:hypothetical protein P7K49_023001 [Saguinus oedipus]|uniref:Uncharacterized protein n=1 Tax=Saguinus oedipus TaxID=9490 RepID=A0ABQ9UKD7_SAGOE|nr:hypothetical protein P7K49_023001 [Saguinus oedipus]
MTTGLRKGERAIPGSGAGRRARDLVKTEQMPIQQLQEQPQLYDNLLFTEAQISFQEDELAPGPDIVVEALLRNDLGDRSTCLKLSTLEARLSRKSVAAASDSIFSCNSCGALAELASHSTAVLSSVGTSLHKVPVLPLPHIPDVFSTDVMRPQGHCNTDHMERDLNIVVHVQHYENMDTRTPINNLRKYSCMNPFQSHVVT